MGKKIFSDDEINSIIKQAEKCSSISELCKINGISETMFQAWCLTRNIISSDDQKKIKYLEDENARLKRIVNEQALELLMLKESGAGKL